MFGVEAIKVKERVPRIIFAMIAVVFALWAVLVQQIANAWPKVGAFLTSIFEQPVAWFVLAVALFFVLRPFWNKPSATRAIATGEKLATGTAELGRQAADLRASLEQHQRTIDERIAGIEADIDSAKDGEETLRAAIQGFMGAAVKLATDLNEQRVGDVKKLSDELHAATVKQATIIEDYQRMLAVEARLEEMKADHGKKIGELFAHRSLDTDGIMARFHRVYDALAAMFHRERLHMFGQQIEAGAAELSGPTNEKIQFDQGAWEQWESKELAWRSALDSWCELASVYVPGVREEVMTTSDEHYKQKGVATVEQFPDAEAFFSYKAFCGVWKNWQGQKERVFRAVHQAAFNGDYTIAKPAMGDGGAIGPG